MPITYESPNGENVIIFTKSHPEWGALSNFIGGVEHKFQAAKYEHDIEQYNAILNAKTPAQAKRLGGKRNGKPLTLEQIKEWNIRRIDVMKKCIVEKFTIQNDYGELLLSTGNRYIIEKAYWDSFWGAGRNGKGKNMLGKILMEHRAKLQSIRDIKNSVSKF